MEELGALGIVRHERRTCHASSYLDDNRVNRGLHAREQGRSSNDSAHNDSFFGIRPVPRGTDGVGESLS